MYEGINFDDPKFRSILERTIALFYEFGIRNLNMDDISRNLGISKKTLYQYVKSKEDLIEKLFYYDEMMWHSNFSELKIESLNAIEILFEVSRMVHNEMRKLNPQLKFELRKYYEPQFNRFMQRKQTQIFEHMSRNILKGIREGLYRSDLNVELMAGLYVRNLIDMHNKDFCMIENITFDQLFSVMFETHIRAIATPEGIAYFEKRKAEIEKLNDTNN
jgi:AcrR family transcriptional regulator